MFEFSVKFLINHNHKVKKFFFAIKKNMNLIHIFIKHYRLITDELDIIKNVSMKWLINTKHNYSNINRFHYLLILLIINYVTIDSGLIIYQNCVIETRCVNLINSTHLFPHRIFPKTFWYQSDLFFIIVMIVTNISFVMLSIETNYILLFLTKFYFHS